MFALVKVTDKDDDGRGRDGSDHGKEIVEPNPGLEGFRGEKNEEADEAADDPGELPQAEGFFEEELGEDGGKDGIGQADDHGAGGTKFDDGDVKDDDAESSENTASDDFGAVEEGGEPKLSGLGVDGDDDGGAGESAKYGHEPAIASWKGERDGAHREGVHGEKEDGEQHQEDAAFFRGRCHGLAWWGSDQARRLKEEGGTRKRRVMGRFRLGVSRTNHPASAKPSQRAARRRRSD